MERPYFSEMLAVRRRELGYSIRQASRVLRLREDVLIAFEEGGFDQMPKSGYAQGMLSSYARYLGLDANEVVDAFVDDYERYKRENQRRARSGGRSRNQSGYQQGGSAQPYVGSRGLLPTSGGPAGDMGSFATTRVHVRGGAYSEEDDGDDGRLADESYPQGRPYTGRTPTTTRRAYRGDRSSSRREIETMDVAGYDDDIRLGRNAQPYKAASTRAGRRSSRSISNAQRPRVRQRSRQSNRNAGRGQDRRRGSRGNARRRGGNNLGLIIAVGAVLALSLIIIISVGSCVRQDTSTAKTVPVSEASASSAKSSSASGEGASKANDSSSQGTDATASAASGSSSKDAQGSSSSSSSAKSNAETSVSVSVADGAVTWLEVECDGKSDVAETVTGPWQKTYTVEDSITVQAGDTSSVSVVQNGKQVQFESMASGIGSIRIQGTKKPTTSKKNGSESNESSSSSKEDEANTSSNSTSSAKLGNASSKDKDGQSGTNDDTQSKTSAGNGADATNNASGNDYGYDEEYGYGNEYGY